MNCKYELGDSASLASTLSNIGFAYNQLDQPDSAYHYFVKAYQLDLLSNDREGQLKSLHNIGLYHLNKEDYDSAMHYFCGLHHGPIPGFVQTTQNKPTAFRITRTPIP